MLLEMTGRMTGEGVVAFCSQGDLLDLLEVMEKCTGSRLRC